VDCFARIIKYVYPFVNVTRVKENKSITYKVLNVSVVSLSN